MVQSEVSSRSLTGCDSLLSEIVDRRGGQSSSPLETSTDISRATWRLMYMFIYSIEGKRLPFRIALYATQLTRRSTPFRPFVNSLAKFCIQQSKRNKLFEIERRARALRRRRFKVALLTSPRRVFVLRLSHVNEYIHDTTAHRSTLPHATLSSNSAQGLRHLSRTKSAMSNDPSKPKVEDDSATAILRPKKR